MWEQLRASSQKLFSADQLIIYGQLALKAVIILLAARLFIYLSNKLIERTLIPVGSGQQGFNRANTLSSVLKSLLRYGIFFLVAVTILDIFGIPVGGVLATASILGVAVGFGAQSLVKDVITGFFIIFENQFGVGETISVLGVTGRVEELGLRLTKL
ncbi:MAG TPA: mechanosensitive ion channel domain-containing protein, partial [Bacillota bacterium]|nr:mechanosensitive ion channel domain-containing protein [Bacillota bacterium]